MQSEEQNAQNRPGGSLLRRITSGKRVVGVEPAPEIEDHAVAEQLDTGPFVGDIETQAGAAATERPSFESAQPPARASGEEN